MFEDDTPREGIIEALKSFVTVHSTVKDWIVPSKYSNKGKIKFVTPKAMQAWVMAHAGKKIEALGKNDIWWSVDKPFQERQLGKKIGFVLRKVKEFFEEKFMIDGKAETKEHSDTHTHTHTSYKFADILRIHRHDKNSQTS